MGMMGEIPGTVLFIAATHGVLIAAFYLSSWRLFHVPVMLAVMVTDVAFPFYLYLTHDWWKRLIDDGEIFSFLLWMHFILIITLYMFYVLQIAAGRRLLRGDMGVRGDHRRQGMGIIVLRTLVFVTGALLVK